MDPAQIAQIVLTPTGMLAVVIWLYVQFAQQAAVLKGMGAKLESVEKMGVKSEKIREEIYRTVHSLETAYKDALLKIKEHDDRIRALEEAERRRRMGG